METPVSYTGTPVASLVAYEHATAGLPPCAPQQQRQRAHDSGSGAATAAALAAPASDYLRTVQSPYAATAFAAATGEDGFCYASGVPVLVQDLAFVWAAFEPTGSSNSGSHAEVDQETAAWARSVMDEVDAFTAKKKLHKALKEVAGAVAKRVREEQRRVAKAMKRGGGSRSKSKSGSFNVSASSSGILGGGGSGDASSSSSPSLSEGPLLLSSRKHRVFSRLLTDAIERRRAGGGAAGKPSSGATSRGTGRSSLGVADPQPSVSLLCVALLQAFLAALPAPLLPPVVSHPLESCANQQQHPAAAMVSVARMREFFEATVQRQAPVAYATFLFVAAMCAAHGPVPAAAWRQLMAAAVPETLPAATAALCAAYGAGQPAAAAEEAGEGDAATEGTGRRHHRRRHRPRDEVAGTDDTPRSEAETPSSSPTPISQREGSSANSAPAEEQEVQQQQPESPASEGRVMGAMRPPSSSSESSPLSEPLPPSAPAAKTGLLPESQDSDDDSDDETEEFEGSHSSSFPTPRSSEDGGDSSHTTSEYSGQPSARGGHAGHAPTAQTVQVPIRGTPPVGGAVAGPVISSFSPSSSSSSSRSSSSARIGLLNRLQAIARSPVAAVAESTPSSAKEEEEQEQFSSDDESEYEEIENESPQGTESSHSSVPRADLQPPQQQAAARPRESSSSSGRSSLKVSTIAMNATGTLEEVAAGHEGDDERNHYRAVGLTENGAYEEVAVPVSGRSSAAVSPSASAPALPLRTAPAAAAVERPVVGHMAPPSSSSSSASASSDSLFSSSLRTEPDAMSDDDSNRTAETQRDEPQDGSVGRGGALATAAPLSSSPVAAVASEREASAAEEPQPRHLESSLPSSDVTDGGYGQLASVPPPAQQSQPLSTEHASLIQVLAVHRTPPPPPEPVPAAAYSVPGAMSVDASAIARLIPTAVQSSSPFSKQQHGQGHVNPATRRLSDAKNLFLSAVQPRPIPASSSSSGSRLLPHPAEAAAVATPATANDTRAFTDSTAPASSPLAGQGTTPLLHQGHPTSTPTNTTPTPTPSTSTDESLAAAVCLLQAQVASLARQLADRDRGEALSRDGAKSAEMELHDLRQAVAAIGLEQVRAARSARLAATKMVELQQQVEGLRDEQVKLTMRLTEARLQSAALRAALINGGGDGGGGGVRDLSF